MQFFKNNEKFIFWHCEKNFDENIVLLPGGLFPVIHPQLINPLWVEAVATVTSVFAEYIFCEIVDSAHKLQTSSSWLLTEAIESKQTDSSNNSSK